MVRVQRHGSYLQGMETIITIEEAQQIVESGTDPTYKEWKLRISPSCCILSRRTDPTYKEWKPITGLKKSSNNPRTDPTYKEWKLFLVLTV